MKTKRIIAWIMMLSITATLLSGCKKSANALSDDSDYQETSVIQNAGDSASKGDGEISNVPSDKKTNSSSNSNTDKNNSKSTGAASGGNKTKQSTGSKIVKYATWEDIYKTEYGPVITAFTKKTGIKVQIISTPQTNYVTKLSAMVAAGNSPDVYKDNSEFPRTLPIAQPINISGINPNDSRWDATVRKMSTVNGKTYLVASKQQIFQCRYLCYYNKTLFEKNGIMSPGDYVAQGNWTWDTLKIASKQIKEAIGSQYGAVLRRESFAAAYGGQFLKLKNGRFVSGVHESNMIDVWNYMLDAEKEGLFHIYNSDPLFTGGKAGIMITDTYGTKAVGYFSKMNSKDLAFTYLPKKSASNASYPSSGFVVGYGIAKGASNPQGAGQFLDYFLNMDNYDISTVYKSEEAKKFAAKICAQPIDDDLQYICDGPGKIVGGTDAFAKYLGGAAGQVTTALNKVSNLVDNAVNKSNEMLDKAS